jgi:hypothetical protein
MLTTRRTDPPALWLPAGECASLKPMAVGVTVRGRVRGGRLQVDAPLDLPDDTEVELAVLLDDGDDLDAEDRARLDAALRASKAELARGEAVPFEQVLMEI